MLKQTVPAAAARKRTKRKLQGSGNAVAKTFSQCSGRMSSLAGRIANGRTNGSNATPF